MQQKERQEGSANGELLGLTKREELWLENYPNGYDIPGSLRLADDYLNTLSPESNLLEIGSGPGRVIRHLIKKEIVKEATGIDINRAAIEFAKKQCKAEEPVSFRTMDGTKLKFPDNNFDNVIMTGVVGGVEPEVREKLMAESFRVVKEGGTVAISEFKYNTDPIKAQKYKDAEAITHEEGTRIIRRGDKELIVKHFTEDELLGLFARAGFTSVQTRGECVETPGLGDGIIESRRQYTVWGKKPSNN